MLLHGRALVSGSVFYPDRCSRVRGRLKAGSYPQSSRKRFTSGRALLFDRKRRSFLSGRALVKFFTETVQLSHRLTQFTVSFAVLSAGSLLLRSSPASFISYEWSAMISRLRFLAYPISAAAIPEHHPMLRTTRRQYGLLETSGCPRARSVRTTRRQKRPNKSRVPRASVIASARGFSSEPAGQRRIMGLKQRDTSLGRRNPFTRPPSHQRAQFWRKWRKRRHRI